MSVRIGDCVKIPEGLGIIRYIGAIDPSSAVVCVCVCVRVFLIFKNIIFLFAYINTVLTLKTKKRKNTLELKF